MLDYQIYFIAIDNEVAIDLRIFYRIWCSFVLLRHATTMKAQKVALNHFLDHNSVR